jgi:deltex
LAFGYSDTTPVMTKACCSTIFHARCLTESLRRKGACPGCSTPFGAMEGTMPPGTMNARLLRALDGSLPGHPGVGVIEITYSVPSGTQSAQHPHPGTPFSGTERTAFLPDNEAGRQILALLRTAFERRLTFTVGRSITTGQDNCVVWNGIHHKTRMHGGAASFGYPDAEYLDRVKDELAAKGVK